MFFSKILKLLPGTASRNDLRGSVLVGASPEMKPSLIGFVEQRSRFHVSGWVHDPQTRGARVEYQVKLRRTGAVLATDRADHFRYGLSGAGIGDGGNAFYLRFDHALATDDVDQVDVIPVMTGLPLEDAPWLSSSYEPIVSFSMDIVDNCNLRCPFCLYDYANIRRTHTMSDDALDAALSFLTLVPDGAFWFSCLHEPTLHPKFIDFIERIPGPLRKKAFFTTNMSKRMPASYFERLAQARLQNINISVESLQPQVFERFRKGARFEVFKENWDSFMLACGTCEDPTPIRYIAMAYKSNLRELPDLVEHLFQHRRAAAVEIRYTFDFEHIPKDFRSSEFLVNDDWLWLREALRHYDDGKVRVIFPPSFDLPGDRLALDPVEPVGAAGENARLSDVRYFLPARYQFRLDSDGSLEVRRHWGFPYDQDPPKEVLAKINVREVKDSLAYLASLPA